MAEIDAKKIHSALKELLDKLAKADHTKLKRRNQRKSSVPQWEEALTKAADEIEEWCPSFTLELPQNE